MTEKKPEILFLIFLFDEAFLIFLSLLDFQLCYALNLRFLTLEREKRMFKILQRIKKVLPLFEVC